MYHVLNRSVGRMNMFRTDKDFAAFHDLLDDATLVCAPLSAGGRWSGVILADRRPRRPLSEEERNLLWTLGKTSALAEAARHATFSQARART